MSNEFENVLIKLFEWSGASGTAISIALQFLSDNSQMLVGISACFSIISYILSYILLFIGRYKKRKKHGSIQKNKRDSI